MRIFLPFGRLCSTYGRASQRLARLSTTPSRRFARPLCLQRSAQGRQKRATSIRPALIAALAPAAFVKLAETDDDDDDDETGERLMLDASRQEIRDDILEKTEGRIPIGGPRLAYWAYYVYDTIATGVRFVHLVVIFLPVILMAPTVWLGKRIKDRDDGARTGTLWWYSFLVKAMERAGPAFIKVGLSKS